MEIVLFSLLMAWGLTRYGVTDLVATAKGTESPRIAAHRQRSAQAHERAMARGGQTVGSAIGSRIADRIAHPHPRPDKPRGPARSYFAGLWADTWDQAAERHRERAAARRPATTTTPDATTSTDERDVPSEHTQKVHIVDHDPTDATGTSNDNPTSEPDPTGPAPRGAESAPEQHENSASNNDDEYETASTSNYATGAAGDQAGRAADPGSHEDHREPIDVRVTQVHEVHHVHHDDPVDHAEADDLDLDLDDEIVDAEIVDDPHTPRPTLTLMAGGRQDESDDVAAADAVDAEVLDAEIVQDPQTTPASPGQGDTFNTEAPTMTTSTTDMASGETLDPHAAKRFADSMRTLAENAAQQIEQSIAALEGRGVAGEPIAQLSQMLESFQTAAGTATSAGEHFDRHIAHQDQLLSDDTIAGTVNGTYVGTAS